MQTRRRIKAFLLTSLFSMANLAIAETKSFKYQNEGSDFEGVLATPKANAETAKTNSEIVKRPGILMVHNWMGVTPETLEQAQKLADLGYVVLAADIYGAGVRPKNQKEAAEISGKYKNNRKLFRKHLNIGLTELSKIQSVDKNKLYAVGYCFGGTGAIELARSGANISKAVSFHGGLDSPNSADGKNIKAKILALHGADDPYVPVKEIEAFETEMKVHKIDWQLVKFGNAVHSFTDKLAGNDNTKGAAYNAIADTRSWEMMKDFLIH
jgi:dienelactone hydrolase